MRPDLLSRIGHPSMERLGAAPNVEEMRSIAQNGAGLYTTGQLRRNLKQCWNCLAWTKLSDEMCPKCGTLYRLEDPR